MGALAKAIENIISKYSYAFPIHGKTISEEVTLRGAISLYELCWTLALDNLNDKNSGKWRDNLVAMIEVFRQGNNKYMIKNNNFILEIHGSKLGNMEEYRNSKFSNK